MGGEAHHLRTRRILDLRCLDKDPRQGTPHIQVRDTRSSLCILGKRTVVLLRRIRRRYPKVMVSINLLTLVWRDPRSLGTRSSPDSPSYV
jgi:hypothetical protein